VPVEEARDLAREKGLDLVEVGPNADPPVCRIFDWGKLRYEKQKKEREAKRRTQTIEVKEVKYRPTIDQHDRDRKTDRARLFLSQGNKVKVTVFFRYRQLRRPQLGQEILDHVEQSLADVANVEHRTRGLEGRQMTMILSPKAQRKEKEKKEAKEPVTAKEPPTEAEARQEKEAS
jgi:translation initiation factor IF-3